MSLQKLPNRSKTYYKITNEKECHNGLQYHDGLVIDPVPFNNDPEASCVKGGIYFTTKEYLPRFFGYGPWIRPVKIPSNAEVVLDAEGDKYRSDKLVFYPRKNMEFYFNKLFNKETFPKEYYYYLANHCSKHFDEWFDKETFPKEYCRYLAVYCSKHFDEWFDKETFPKGDYWCLVKYCQKYKKIWDN